MEGAISPSFLHAQSCFYSILGSSKSPRRWIIALIQKLWDVSWDMWSHRNGLLHDRNTGSKAILLQNTIQDLMRSPLNSVSLPNRYLLRQDLNRLLSASQSYQSSWIARVDAAQARYARQQQSQQPQLNRQRTLMQRFFSIAPSTEDEDPATPINASKKLSLT
jgi:hypothetical protein